MEVNNDGIQHHKITYISLTEQCFDVNGMYQTHTVGYTVYLTHGKVITLDINGALLETQPL